MAKIKGNGHGNSDWKAVEKEQDDAEFINSILNMRGADEKGHTERQNIRFSPNTIQKLSTIMAEKIRPEAKTIHDLIRGYVDRMAHLDLERGGKNVSEFSAAFRHLMSANKKIKEEHAGLYILEREIEEAVKNSNSEDEAKQLITNILFQCPQKLKKNAKKFFQKITIRGKNKRGLSYSSFHVKNNDDSEDEEMGDDEFEFK